MRKVNAHTFSTVLCEHVLLGSNDLIYEAELGKPLSETSTADLFPFVSGGEVVVFYSKYDALLLSICFYKHVLFTKRQSV